MPSALFGGLASAFARGEALNREQQMQDEDRAQAKRNATINRAAMLAGLAAQGIDTNPVAPDGDQGDNTDATPLGDTGYFLHRSLTSPKYTFEKTDQGIVAIDQHGNGRLLSDPTGKPLGAKTETPQKIVGPDGSVQFVDPTAPPPGLKEHVTTPAKPKYSQVMDESGNLFLRNDEDPTDTKPLMVNGKQLKGHIPPDAQPPSNQVLQTPGGYVFVNPKDTNAPATPVKGPNGEQIKPEPPRPPAQLIQAYNQNRKQLTIIDDAIDKIKAHPNAVGLSRGRSDTIDQMVDPTGVDARAAIADVGSMTLHDRSGAAVTASEWPRLAPFIPKASDKNAETVIKKLQRMRDLVQEQTNYLQDQVGGYSNPGGSATTTTTTPAATTSTKKKGGGAFSDLVPGGTP